MSIVARGLGLTVGLGTVIVAAGLGLSTIELQPPQQPSGFHATGGGQLSVSDVLRRKKRIDDELEQILRDAGATRLADQVAKKRRRFAEETAILGHLT